LLAAARLAQAHAGLHLLGATTMTLTLLVQVLAARRPVAALAWRRRAL
jgi:hypothetical protein